MKKIVLSVLFVLCLSSISVATIGAPSPDEYAEQYVYYNTTTPVDSVSVVDHNLIITISKYQHKCFYRGGFAIQASSWIFNADLAYYKSQEDKRINKCIVVCDGRAIYGLLSSKSKISNP